MEESASQNIDQLLNAAGWQVCHPQDAHITAHQVVAIREFPFRTSQGFTGYQLYIDGKTAWVIEAKSEGVSNRIIGGVATSCYP
jgi:type I site-specific restriction endonuclease